MKRLTLDFMMVLASALIVHGCAPPEAKNPIDNSSIDVPPAEISSVDQNSNLHAGFIAMARDVGIDPYSYADDARRMGTEPGETLAADLIICANAGGCPGHVTQDEAKAEICRKIGEGC